MEPARIEELRARAQRLRMHCLRSTTEAESGHPTSCFSAAEIASVLFFHAMRFDPHDPTRPDGDRFVLSKGHAAPLLYAVMTEFGVLTEEENLTLRKFYSDLEGHPTPRLPFVDVATGSLGQGLSAGLGMALASTLDGYDARTYVLMGDGETAEGSVWEAANWAGKHRVKGLTALIDVNGLGQTGPTLFGHDLEAYRARFNAFGWRPFLVDGHDVEEIGYALERVLECEEPTVILAKTEKGHGVSFLAGNLGSHGQAVPQARLDDALREVNAQEMPQAVANLPEAERPTVPAVPAVFEGAQTPLGRFDPEPRKRAAATRKAYGEALAKLLEVMPRAVVLDADVRNSTYSELALANHPRRFFECYIAEQNMVGMAAGFASRGFLPFVSTFGAFLTRALDQLRMAAISGVDLSITGSHAGLSIGEDGPSQMALEDLAMMRALPGSTVLYPSDPVACERLVGLMARTRGLVYLRTSRPELASIYDPQEQFELGGFKVLHQTRHDQALVVGAGVTLHEALKAHQMLSQDGIPVRVIDLYCLKPIDAEALSRHAREASNKLITVEDHYPEGGLGEAVLSALYSDGYSELGEPLSVERLAVKGLPRSGTKQELLDHYGISARHIAEAVRRMVFEQAA